MELNIAVCDDDATCLDEIVRRTRSAVEKSAFTAQIKRFANGQGLVEKAGGTPFHIALLDIDMPILSGFQTAAELQKAHSGVNIIFITNHDDKVFQSYEYHPFWFVRKSRIAELDSVLARLLGKLEVEYAKGNTHAIKTENADYPVDFGKVMYFEAYKHYANVRSCDGRDAEIRCKVSEIARQLEPFHFVRVQAGYVVNCRFIAKITSRHLFLSQGNVKLHINRDRLDEVRAAFQKYMRSER